MHRFPRTAVFTLAMLLTGCNDDAADAGPAAPAPGAVLYAQASTLRPLRPGAVWTFRGHDFTRNAAFENLVRQSGSTGAVAESQSAMPAMQLSYSLSATGDVLQRGALVLPWRGKPLPIDAIELRSPVRLNDRWTVFDGMVDDIGVDLDADHVNEAASVAIQSHVVGNEVVTLPGMLPRQTLRVDTHVAVALRMSGGAQPAVTERVLSTWYAPGIGPVRTALHSTTTGREFDREQRLVTWDGITEGLGYLSQPLVFPAGTGALAGTPLPPALLALALEDGALVLTESGSGYAVHRLDLRGALLSTHLYPAAEMFKRAIKFLRLRSGPRLASFSDTGIDLHAFTEDGQRVGDAPVASLPGAYDATVAALAGSDALWVAWSTLKPLDDYDALHTVLLQRFAEDGRALTAPLVMATLLDSPLLGNFPLLRSLAASSTSAVLTWETLVRTYHFSMASNQGAVLTPDPTYAPARSYPAAFADATGQWLGWVNDGDPLSAPNGLFPHGARLDASGAYVLDGTGMPTAQIVAALGADAASDWPWSFAALDGHLVGTHFTQGKFWPEDAAESDWFVLGDLDATAPVLSTGSTLVVQVRVPWEGGVAGMSHLPLLFADRALLLYPRAGQLQSVVVWRR